CVSFGTVIALCSVERAGTGGKIGARTKGATGPGYNDRTDIVVRVRLSECINHLVHHRRGERVELVRTIEGNGKNIVREFSANLFVSQYVLPLSLGRPVAP